MEPPSPPSCPPTVTVRRNPPRRARPAPSPALVLPLADLEAGPTSRRNPQRKARPAPSPAPMLPLADLEAGPTPTHRPTAENLRVYLRIRPLELTARAGPQLGSRSRHNAKMDPARKKVKQKGGGEICLTATGSHSVALTPPPSLGEKRLKHESYEGFSHVFAPDSVQEDIYLAVMEPLVEGFLRGKNGLLVAMGPSGSGKTHTVFGTPRVPGLVPRALSRLFSPSNLTDTSGSAKAYCLSMFEIYSEKGKSEKLIDLSSSGADLYLQKATVKGLTEAKVSTLTEAHAVITQGLLKRTTAATSINNQSSRSQCVISIRSAPSLHEDENDFSTSNVLTIVDLAGAEREAKTGNQGARLLESNFINNTSMVFGQCLRSLLDHQKNPKKPLQKHYQYSLLTKYLREYLEGKKQMTLLLTAKSGEADYLDTALLLRQASPFMNIKYSNAGESSNVPNLKREASLLARTDKPKRRKCLEIGVAGASKKPSTIPEEKKHESFQPTLQEQWNGDYCKKLAKERRAHQITLGFSRALWKILREYKQKLQISEDRVQNLKESVEKEKHRTVELEKDFTEVKSCLLILEEFEKAKSCLLHQEEKSEETEKEFESLLSTSLNVEALRVESHLKDDKGFLHDVCTDSCQIEEDSKEERNQVSTPKLTTEEKLRRRTSQELKSEETEKALESFLSSSLNVEELKVESHLKDDKGPLLDFCTDKCQIEEVLREERNQVPTPMLSIEEKSRRRKVVPLASYSQKPMSSIVMDDESIIKISVNKVQSSKEPVKEKNRTVEVDKDFTEVKSCLLILEEFEKAVSCLLHQEEKSEETETEFENLLSTSVNVEEFKVESHLKDDKGSLHDVCANSCQIEEVSKEERNQVSTPKLSIEEKPRRRTSQELKSEATEEASEILFSTSLNVEEIKVENQLKVNEGSIHDVCTDICEIEKVLKEERNQVSTSKLLIEEKPRRRKVVPLSSYLQKQMSSIGMEDESIKKNNRKKNVEEKAQTRGTETLVRILRNNLNL